MKEGGDNKYEPNIFFGQEIIQHISFNYCEKLRLYNYYFIDVAYFYTAFLLKYVNLKDKFYPYDIISSM